MGRVAFSGLSAVVALARSAAATTINVNAGCTLPEAVTSFNDRAANPLAAPQPGCSFASDGQSTRTIVVPAGSFNVTTNMEVRADMTVVGAGQAQTTVATTGTRGFTVFGGPGLGITLTLRALSLLGTAMTTGVRVDAQAEPAHLALDGVRVANYGRNGLEALGILEGPSSSIEITNSLVEDNGLAGIEVFNADLTISGSTVSGNANSGVRATLDDPLLQVNIIASTIADNMAQLGGGVYFEGQTGADSPDKQLSIIDSTIAANAATLDGGGVFATECTGLFERTLVSDNDAGRDGGGIFATEGFDLDLNLRLSETTLLGNRALTGSGGGVAILNPGSRSALIEYSLLADNVAALDGGGAFMNALGVVFKNSTLDGNAASRGGGWFYAGPSEGEMSDCTVSDNTASVEAGGVYFVRANPIFAGNLIATNTAPFAPDIVVFPSGLNELGSRCLIGDDEGAQGAFPPGDNIVGVDPLLGARQNVGGFTEVRPLLAGSPAIDAAASGPELDQRGVSRPQGAAFDIGAFEGSCVENEHELVSNRGFEANTTGWVGSFGTTISSSTLQAHSGTHSLRVASRNLGSWQGAEYNLLGSAIPGETLEANLWARVAGDPSEPVLFTLRSTCQGSSTVFTSIATATATDSGWVALNGTVEIPNCTLTELVAYAEGPRTGIVLYVDDVSVQRTTLQCDGSQTPLEGTFVVTNDWGSGYCGELRVTNPNSVATSGWSASFDLNGTTIYTDWNLDLTSFTGSPTASSSESWGQIIAPGATSHSLGFCANRPSGSTALPGGWVVSGTF